MKEYKGDKFWKKLPNRFGKYVRSGQLKRARWFLEYREGRKMNSIRYLEIRNMQSMAQAQQQSSYGHQPLIQSGFLDGILGGNFLRR